MTPLEEVLSGRDERAACQKRMLASREGAFVCQIGLNVPGFPKRVPGDITIIKDCRRFLLACAGAAPFEEHYLDNGAGLCWQGAFDGKSYDAGALKRAARPALAPRHGAAAAPLPRLRRKREGLRARRDARPGRAARARDKDNKDRRGGKIGVRRTRFYLPGLLKFIVRISSAIFASVCRTGVIGYV